MGASVLRESSTPAAELLNPRGCVSTSGDKGTLPQLPPEAPVHCNMSTQRRGDQDAGVQHVQPLSVMLRLVRMRCLRRPPRGPPRAVATTGGVA